MIKISSSAAIVFLCFLFIACEPDDPNYPPDNFSHNFGSVTDIEGNVYRTIKIGTQTWMADNLKTTTYLDGSPIAHAEDNTQWMNNTDGAYSWYDNDQETYAEIYGAMYNWYAVNNSAGLCPSGWEVPNESQWETLTRYLDGRNVAGGKMKEIGVAPDGLWNDTNEGATNESGFSGIPGGYRSTGGSYYSIGDEGYWWSATSSSEQYAYVRTLRNLHTWLVGFVYYKISGHSVRCIQQ